MSHNTHSLINNLVYHQVCGSFEIATATSATAATSTTSATATAGTRATAATSATATTTPTILSVLLLIEVLQVLLLLPVLLLLAVLLLIEVLMLLQVLPLLPVLTVLLLLPVLLLLVISIQVVFRLSPQFLSHFFYKRSGRSHQTPKLSYNSLSSKNYTIQSYAQKEEFQYHEYYTAVKLSWNYIGCYVTHTSLCCTATGRRRLSHSPPVEHAQKRKSGQKSQRKELTTVVEYSFSSELHYCSKNITILYTAHLTTSNTRLSAIFPSGQWLTPGQPG